MDGRRIIEYDGWILEDIAGQKEPLSDIEAAGSVGQSIL